MTTPKPRPPTHARRCRCDVCAAPLLSIGQRAVQAHRLAEAKARAIERIAEAEEKEKAKHARARAPIDRDVEETDRKLAELRAAGGRAPDPQMDVFLALRRAGKTVAEATAEVERRFGAEGKGNR